MDEKNVPVVGWSTSLPEESQNLSVPDGRRSGFSMVEVIIAIVILAFGLLGMAGTTAVVIRQISLADVATERAAALQTTIERLRAAAWNSLTTTLASGTDSVGIFQVTWTSVSPSGQWAVFEIVTLGPGMDSGGGFPQLTSNVADTFTYRILR